MEMSNPMSEWKFPRDTAFRKQFFVPDSFAHPAKMDAQLLIRIVETYTEPGETILDPMAGSGTTMLACMLGRNVILLELEEKFVGMCRDNWEQVRMRPQLGYTMGECVIMQGDARQLDGLLVDKIVTSPPYAEAKQFQDSQFEDKMRIDTKRLGAVRKYNPEAPDNIGNLPYGAIDKIVTSSPYAEQVQGSRHSDHQPEQRRRRLIKAGYNPDDYQLGKGRQCEVVWEYGKAPEQIGNLPYGEIDKIITSPPYEGIEKAGKSGIDNTKLTHKRSRYQSSIRAREIIAEGYSPSEDNIGNFKSTSYLEAMLQVYQQCYKVLKLQGLLILVLKNFIRNKQIIRLDLDTIKLCEQAGFSFVERHYRKLPSQSFWRIIYHQKHPDVPVIDKENILVFRK
jgi:DNA modification methylase